MGSVTKKLQKRIALGKDYNNKYLTLQEYEHLQYEVMKEVADKMMTDVLCVTMEILDKDWGKIHRRKDRFKVFGALFKSMLKEQSHTHKKDYLPKLVEGGLTRLEYGPE